MKEERVGLFGFFKRGPVRAREAASRAEEDRGWRRASYMSGSPLNPERDELDGEALMRECYLAYRTNPLAYAIVEQTTSFVLGGGARVVAEDARVQKVIDAFWNDPDNDMPRRIYSIQTELSLFGEQFIRFYADRLTGRVLIRQLDPLYLTQIRTHPEDIEHPLAYLYQPPGAAGATLGESPENWIAARDILHVTVNRVSGSLRGRSDLACILPYLRRYREWLDDRIIQNKLKSCVVWDVSVAGADKTEINQLRAESAHPPARGTVLFHSDTETWKPVNPEIDAGDAAPDGRAIRLMICTGAMLPEHYLSEGGNANRATAAEMGAPSIKRFQRRQQLFRAVVTRIIERALDEAQRVGRLGPRVNRAFAVQFEELSTSPLVDLAATVARLSEALAVASEHGWVTPEEARRLWWRYAAQADESAPQAEPEAG